MLDASNSEALSSRSTGMDIASSTCQSAASLSLHARAQYWRRLIAPQSCTFTA